MELPLVRALLFAPAGRADLVAKLPRAGADIAVLDLEDGTLPAELTAARTGVAEALPTLRAAGQTTYIRTHPAGDEAFPGDLVAEPDGWVLPKAEDPAVVTEAVDRLGGPVILGLETVQGVLHAPALAAAHDSIVGVYFGAEDFITDIGGRRTRAGHEVLHARSAVVLAAHAAGVRAIDLALADVRDDERFAADAEAGRDLGYDGKLCIHPRQVELALAAFSPSAEEVEASRRLVDAFDEAAARGDGTPLIDGRMIDAPLVNRARDVLARAGHAG